MADVARAYYLESASKVDIAARHGISRFQVAKLLDDALALGVVSIRIRDPRDQGSDLDARLAAALGIPRVDVVEADGGAEPVGLAVMHALEEHVRAGQTIGISWSRTMDLAAKHFPDLPPCTIVQLAGALQNQGAGSLPAVIQRLGRSEEIATLPVHAPLVVGSPATATDLMHQPEIAEALSRAGSLDLAVVAIGAWRAGESSVWEKVSAADRDAADAAGAVGEISGRLFDADGRAVHTALDARTIGGRLDQLARTPEIVAVARGADRVTATTAAVRSGLVTHLVVDRPLADALLAAVPPHTAPDHT
jgi:DNA-binding transcriptional regulator LsrR (DeoR family)